MIRAANPCNQMEFSAMYLNAIVQGMSVYVNLHTSKGGRFYVKTQRNTHAEII